VDITQHDNMIALGLTHRYEVAFVGVASAASAYIGIVTGPEEVVVLGRTYVSDQSVLSVALHEASFTGGADTRHLNRRLSSNSPQPVASMKQGVTPGALGAIITGTKLRSPTSTGNSVLEIHENESKLYLKANTSYVVALTNGGNGTAEIGSSIDMRKVVAGITNESGG
jgi:hypothetical protein